MKREPEAVGARMPAAPAAARASSANGSAFSAELLPIQKIAPCGWPGLKPRKLPRPPPPPPTSAATATTTASANPPPKSASATQPAAKSAAASWPPRHSPHGIVSIASRIRSMFTPAIGLTWPDCPADGHRIAAEVGVARNRRQRRAAAPAAPVASPCRAASALIRLKFSAPLPASCWIAAAARLLLDCCLLLLLRAAREASINEKFTVWSWLAAFSTASCDPAANAANCVRITYRPFCGIVIDHAPVMSVVVEYFLPVRVFCAVTVTPGSGMFPLFTTPCSLPPAISRSGSLGVAP